MLGWELAPEFEHLSEQELSNAGYLELILGVLDAKAGVRDDDERRQAFRAVMAENSRRRDESLMQFALRRQRDFQRAAAHNFLLPSELRAAMLREGAGLSEQNLQNLSALLVGKDSDPDAMARALGRLDVRTDRLVGFADDEGSSTWLEEHEGEAPDDDEQELSEEEILEELDSLDLSEDQVCEVFAVLGNHGGFRRKRSWKENKAFKAEVRKDRGSFVKGDDAPPKGHSGGTPGFRDHPRGQGQHSGGRGGFRGRDRLSREQLKKISKCNACGKKGHWAAECPQKHGMSGFVYIGEPEEKHSVAFSFLSRGDLQKALASVVPSSSSFARSLDNLSLLTLASGDAIVDTGATQDLIGSTAFRALEHRLNEAGLQPIIVDAPCAAPSGIGGKAAVDKVALVPVSFGGFSGVLQMVVLSADVPPLLSIGFLTFLGALIDLPKNQVVFSKFGLQVPMTVLPSGHRTVPLVEWKGGTFEVPEQLRRRYGLEHDAFDLKAGSSLQYMKRGSPPASSVAGCCGESLSNRSRSLPTPFSALHVSDAAGHARDVLSTGVASADAEGMSETGETSSETRVGPSPMFNISVEEPLASASSTCDSFDEAACGLQSPRAAMASSSLKGAHRARVEQAHVLSAGPLGTHQEGQGSSTQTRVGARECGRLLPSPGQQGVAKGQSMGHLESLHSVRSSRRLCLEAPSEGEDEVWSGSCRGDCAGPGDHRCPMSYRDSGVSLDGTTPSYPNGTTELIDAGDVRGGSDDHLCRPF